MPKVSIINGVNTRVETHQHQYTIPVEWENVPERKPNKLGTRAWNAYKKVTKLRCSCGKETTR